MNADKILKSVTAVTKKWTKQRQREQRGFRRGRSDAMLSCASLSIKYAAWSVMADAYHAASHGGTLPVSARQMFYAVRPKVLESTGRSSLDSMYFAQRVLPDYIADHPDETAEWDIVYDARGHLEGVQSRHSGRKPKRFAFLCRDRGLVKPLSGK